MKEEVSEIGKVQKEFLGINLPNWIVIVSLFLTVLLVSVSAGSRITSVEEKTAQNKEDIQECKVRFEKYEKDVSVIKNDVSEIKGMVKVLLRK
jgi:hypothetical protein